MGCFEVVQNGLFRYHQVHLKEKGWLAVSISSHGLPFAVGPPLSPSMAVVAATSITVLPWEFTLVS